MRFPPKTLAVASKNRRSGPRSPRARRLVLEGLEVRCLLAASPVAHWAFDQGQVSQGIVTDLSGNAHHIELVNGPVSTTGAAGAALQFDGVDDYANVGSDAAILGKGAFTVTAWLKTTASTEQVIVQQRSPAGYDGEYVLQTMPSGQIRFWTFGDGQYGADVLSAKTVNDGQWRFVVAVREADGTGKLYVDGQLDGQHAAPSRTMASIDLALGADTRAQSRFFAGALDDVRIYNRALAPTELAALLQAGQGPSEPQPESDPANPPTTPLDADFYAAANAVLVVPAPGVLANHPTVSDPAVPANDPAVPANDPVPADSNPNVQVGYYVSVDGSSSGDGSINQPWSLTDVLTSPPQQIGPGDVIWVRGGVYRGPFVSNLTGTAEAPIVVRAFPGEDVQLDLYNPDQWEQAFFVMGDHVIYQGFEVTSSSPGPRTTAQSGPFQTDVNRGGISVRGHYNKFVNLVVHDLNAGIGYWGDGGEIHGSIIYNNGWDAPDRQHGHGFYLQNENGLKSISDNIVFNQFGAGIHAYGSDKAHLNNLYFEGNVSFNNGAGVGQGFMPERDILVGGIATTRNVTLNENYTFQNGLNGIVDVGYLWGPENEDVRFTDNYFVSSVRFLKPFDDVTFTGNTVVEAQQPVSLTIPQDGVISDYVWDGNRYIYKGQVSFNLANSVQSVDAWRFNTGFDANSVVETSSAAEAEVFVRPNHYEAGRANVIVYNWGQQAAVSVDLTPVLKIGDSYQLHSAIDYYGDPVLTGVYDGQPIVVPMINRSAPAPLGYNGAFPVGTDSRFSVFVVTSVGSNGGGPNPDDSSDAGSTGGLAQLAVTTRQTTSQLGAAVTLTSDGGFTYDPTSLVQAQRLAAGEIFSDRFSYTVSDGRLTSLASATVQLSGVNDRPVASNVAVDVSQTESAVEFRLLADDVDSNDDADSLRYRWLTLPARGELVDLGSGRFSFDPAGEFSELSAGEQSIEVLRYRVTDRHGATDEAEVTIRVLGTNTGPDASPPPTDGLLAHWTLDDGGGTTAADQSGNGYHGTLDGDPLWSDGQLGGAVDFDGAGDHINVGLGPAIVGTGGFTVSAWVRSSANSNQVIVQQRSSAGYNGQYQLHLTAAGKVRFWTFGGTYGPIAESSATINDGQWHHVVGVREDDGTTKIYIDGAVDGSKAGAPRPLIPIDVYLGADMRGHSSFLIGSLDDVRIYNRALSAAELAGVGNRAGFSAAANLAVSIPSTAKTTSALDSHAATSRDPGLIDLISSGPQPQASVSIDGPQSLPVTNQSNGWQSLSVSNPNLAAGVGNAAADSNSEFTESLQPTHGWNSLADSIRLFFLRNRLK